MRHADGYARSFLGVLTLCALFESNAPIPQPPIVSETGGLAVMQVFVNEHSYESLALSKELADRRPDVVLLQNDTTLATTNSTWIKNQHRLLNEARDVIEIVANIAKSKEQQEFLLAAMGSLEWILVESTSEWKMIPAENLIAMAKSSGIKLIFCVQEAPQRIPTDKAWAVSACAV